MSDIFTKPKTDLHAHMALSAPFKTYELLAGRELVKPKKKYRDLKEFLDYVHMDVLPAFENADATRTILKESLNVMVNAGVNYTELSFDLVCALAAGQQWDEFVEDCKSIINELSGKIVVVPELGVRRESEEGFWRREVPKALNTGFFRSIDLYGDESAASVDQYIDYFNWGRDAGAKIKFHIGEISDPEKIKYEIRKINPDAIQHGVRASEDQEAMEMIANRGINVNVCPTSNVCLSVTKDYRTHPIRALFDAGCRVTLNSDDYSVFGVTANDEYRIMYEEGIFNLEELEQIRVNGIMAGTFFD